MLALVSCGGRSVSRDEDAPTGADAAAGEQDAGRSVAPATSEVCLALCGQCGLDALVNERSCDDFCSEVETQAADADCGDLYDDLVRCRAKSANACSFTACPSPTNAFSVCVLTYCDEHPYKKPLCTAW